MTPWYDDRKGIQEAVDKGIPGLKELRVARHTAGYKREEKDMTEWVLVGYFHLSRNGNFDKIIEGAPRDHPKGYTLGQVATNEEVKTLRIPTMTFTSCWLPPTVEKCDRCLHGWTMRNVSDYQDYRREDDPHRHESCEKLRILDDSQQRFREIVEGAGIVLQTPMRTIPNEYHNEWDNPWFLLDTDKGLIRIGHRKKVIHIDWYNSDIEHTGDDLFDDQEVTTGERMVHAWGSEKAIEYLKRICG